MIHFYHPRMSTNYINIEKDNPKNSTFTFKIGIFKCYKFKLQDKLANGAYGIVYEISRINSIFPEITFDVNSLNNLVMKIIPLNISILTNDDKSYDGKDEYYNRVTNEEFNEEVRLLKIHAKHNCAPTVIHSEIIKGMYFDTNVQTDCGIILMERMYMTLQDYSLKIKDTLPKDKRGELLYNYDQLMKPFIDNLVKAALESGSFNRDIFPNNIMVNINGANKIIKIVLIDFGLSEKVADKLHYHFRGKLLENVDRAYFDNNWIDCHAEMNSGEKEWSVYCAETFKYNIK